MKLRKLVGMGMVTVMLGAGILGGCLGDKDGDEKESQERTTTEAKSDNGNNEDESEAENESEDSGDFEYSIEELKELSKQVGLCDYGSIPVTLGDDEMTNQTQVLDYLIKNCTFPEIPQGYIDDYKKDMQEYYESYMQIYGIDLNTYLSGMGMTEEEFEQEKQTAAEHYMKSNLALKAIAAKEGLELTDADISAYSEEFASLQGFESVDALYESLEAGGNMVAYKEQILFEKVLDVLYGKCVGNGQ